MKTALVVTNRNPDDSGGRAEKIATRQKLFEELGWDIELAVVSEPYIARFPLALVRVVRRVRAVDPDVVISMVNPFHLHVLGYAAGRVAGVPWVAEFRDPILTRPGWEAGSPLRQVAGAVERLAARQADRVVWLDGIQLPDGYFETVYPGRPTETFVKLPYMGYDHTQFQRGEQARYDQFTVTYAGSFYEGWIEPYGFLEGLGSFRGRRPDATIRVQFYGDWNESYQQAAENAGVADCVETHGFVPFTEVVPALEASHALLYVGGSDPDNRLNVPSKLWDYVGADRPILAVVDESFAVADLVDDHGLGVVAPPTDTAAIADAIEALYDDAVNYEPTDEVRSYTRERHARAYAQVLDDVIALV